MESEIHSLHSTMGGQYKWLFPRIHTKSNHQNNLIFRLQTGHCRLKHHLHRIGSHQIGGLLQDAR